MNDKKLIKSYELVIKAQTEMIEGLLKANDTLSNLLVKLSKGDEND